MRVALVASSLLIHYSRTNLRTEPWSLGPSTADKLLLLDIYYRIGYTFHRGITRHEWYFGGKSDIDVPPWGRCTPHMHRLEFSHGLTVGSITAQLYGYSRAESRRILEYDSLVHYLTSFDTATKLSQLTSTLILCVVMQDLLL